MAQLGESNKRTSIFGGRRLSAAGRWLRAIWRRSRHESDRSVDQRRLCLFRWRYFQMGVL